MTAASNGQYDALARFIVALGRLRGGPGPEDLCIHKALRGDPGGGSRPGNSTAARNSTGNKSATNAWLAARIAEAAPARILDVGCGFGTLAAALCDTLPATVVGINASKFPVTYGRSFWSARMGDRAPILRHAEIGSPLEEPPFDAAVSVEALSYATDLDAAFAWLARAVKPDGTLWVLDDWAAPDLDPSDPDRRALCDCWRRDALHSRAEIEAAAARHGLRPATCVSLTALVPARYRAPGTLRRRLLALAVRLFGASRAGEVAGAFLGGWHLERLYARGACHYELLELRAAIDET